jgi:hypothetical protein
MENATWYDILSLSLLSINVILTFYVCYLCNKIPEYVLTKKYKTSIKLLMNGIALTEVLFLISLHSWILNDMGASIGYLDSFSSLIYTIAENVKSLLFLTIIIMVIKWVKIKLNFVKECVLKNVK